MLLFYDMTIQKLPRHFKYHGTNVLEISGTNGHPVLGIFIFGFAAFVLAIGTGFIHTHPEQISDDIQKILIGISLLIFMLGMHFGFWSSHSYIDKTRGTLFYKSGLFGLGKTLKYPLSEFDTIKRGFIEGDSDSNPQYPIQLVSSVTEKPSPTLSTPYNLQGSQQELDILTSFLQWPVVDMTLGPISHVVAIDKNSSNSAEKIALPPNTHLLIKDTLGEITVTYPLPNMMGATILSSSMPLAFILFVFWDALWSKWVCITLFILIWILIILLIIRKYKKSPALAKLSFNSKELNISHLNGRSKNLTIPLGDIRAISLHANEISKWNWPNKIIVQTSSEQHEIAKSLTPDDTTYIYKVIKDRL